MDRTAGRRPVMLFDLDDTLLDEERSVEAALLATSELARARHGTDPRVLQRAVRERAREIWNAAPTIDYCRALGIASWEGLWSAFPGDAPELAALRAWAPTYRHEAWGRGLADCGVDDPTLAEELASVFFQREPPSAHLVVYPEVEPVLQALRRTHRLGLVTNGLSDLQRGKLAVSCLEPYFDLVAVSTEVGVGKPDARIFAWVLAALDAGTEQTAMVGDSLWRDVAGARTAGIRAIWLNRSGAARDGSIRPDAEITTLARLHEVLSAE